MPVEFPVAQRRRLSSIRLIVVDVDGVLTDGTLYYGADGEVIKAFHVRDGMGIQILREAGIDVAAITGRTSSALNRRMAELGVNRVLSGRSDKSAALEELLSSSGIAACDVAFVGDDVLDIPPMRRVGLAVSVSDAHPRVREVAHWVTKSPGGRGALREIADAVVASRREPDLEFDVVIPARYGAKRLPGKPLRELAGRSLIAHVWEHAVEAGAKRVLVATDDQRILSAVESFGGQAVMTSPTCESGTDRVAEVIERFDWPADRIVLNLQGDEPLIPGDLMRQVVQALGEHEDAGIATLATAITSARELFDPNVVKVVLDNRDMASYFSRAPIPWHRDAFSESRDVLPPETPFLRHIGLYAYRAGAVRRLAAEPRCPSERAESLEQLRALALGIPVHVTVVPDAPPHGVDSEADLERVARWLRDGEAR